MARYGEGVEMGLEVVVAEGWVRGLVPSTAPRARAWPHRAAAGRLQALECAVRVRAENGAG